MARTGHDQEPVPGRAADLATSLLIESGAVLAGSLELGPTMRQVASLLVPRLADLAVIDLLEHDGSITGVAVAAARPRLARDLEDLRRRYPLDRDGPHPVARVIRSGRPQLIADLSAGAVQAFARSSEHARFMIESGYRSVIVAPLTTRERVLGALSALRIGPSSVAYGRRDLELVVELGRRAAVAIDNARLYSDLERVERRLDAVLANVAEAMTVVDTAGRTVFANRAAAELLGFGSPSELAQAPPGSVIARFAVRDERGADLSLEDMPSRRLLRGERAQPLLVQNIVPQTGAERWLVVRSSAVSDPTSGRTAYVVNAFEDVTELKRAELGERFMAQASRLLVSSMDYERTLAGVAERAVPALADWCAIDVARNRDIERVALRHRDGPGAELAVALPPQRGLISEVIRTGAARLHPDLAAEAGRHPALAALRDGGARALVVVAVPGTGRTIGAVSLASFADGRRLTARDRDVAERVARRIGTAVENARLYRERTEIVRTLERALLPGALPELEGLELAARHQGSGGRRALGGVFCDIVEQRDGRWVLMIAGVSGSGVQAAALTALARHTLRAATISRQAPAQMLETLHRALQRHSPPGGTCRAALVALEPACGSALLEIALAGQPAPLRVGRDGSVRPIGAPGRPAGGAGELRARVERITLEQGETLVLHTGRVGEARGRGGRLELGELAEACRGAAGIPLDELLDRIEGTAAHGRARARAALTLVALRVV